MLNETLCYFFFVPLFSYWEMYAAFFSIKNRTRATVHISAAICTVCRLRLSLCNLPSSRLFYRSYTSLIAQCRTLLPVWFEKHFEFAAYVANLVEIFFVATEEYLAKLKSISSIGAKNSCRRYTLTARASTLCRKESESTSHAVAGLRHSTTSTCRFPPIRLDGLSPRLHIRPGLRRRLLRVHLPAAVSSVLPSAGRLWVREHLRLGALGGILPTRLLLWGNVLLSRCGL